MALRVQDNFIEGGKVETEISVLNSCNDGTVGHKSFHQAHRLFLIGRFLRPIREREKVSQNFRIKTRLLSLCISSNLPVFKFYNPLIS